tara:strand:+ start:1452 stop:1874 length:423 start_codon:yes stop_codon:yes gene_type:complete
MKLKTKLNIGKFLFHLIIASLMMWAGLMVRWKINPLFAKEDGLFLIILIEYFIYYASLRKLKPLIKDVMLNTFKKQQKDTLQEIEVNKKAINDIERKLARLEERFVFEEINTAQYEKFKSMLTQEKNEKLMFSEKVGFNL